MPYLHPEQASAQQKVPPWIFIGGPLLAVIAAYVNVIVILSFSVPISHMTGIFSRLSIDLGLNKAEDLVWVLSIMGGFFIGALLSGLLIGNPRLKAGRSYGLALILEGVILGCASFLIQYGHRSGVSVAALACGLQNGLASSYHGLILRTTHMTGIITDIAVFIGQWIRYRTIVYWKLLLLMVLALGYFAGGLLGAFCYLMLGLHAMYFTALACILIGGIYFFLLKLHDAQRNS